MSRAHLCLGPVCSLEKMVGKLSSFFDQSVHTEHGHIIIVCISDSVIVFYSILEYLWSLAVESYTIALLSRNLSDTLNWAKILKHRTLMFFSILVTLLPVSHSTKGNVMVATEILFTLSCSEATLDLIFGPKCYIILICRIGFTLLH